MIICEYEAFGRRVREKGFGLAQTGAKKKEREKGVNVRGCPTGSCERKNPPPEGGTENWEWTREVKRDQVGVKGKIGRGTFSKDS